MTTKSITVCVDTSGSMSENGKLIVARTIVLSVAQACSMSTLCRPPDLVNWGPTIDFIDWASEDPYPKELLAGHGNAEVNSLIRQLEDMRSELTILITDGSFQSSDKKKINRWARAEPSSRKLVYVGDENIRQSDEHVLEASNVAWFARLWCSGVIK